MTVYLEFINKYIFGAITPILLLSAGIYLSFRLNFFHLRHPIRILKTILTKKEKGGTSPFRALTVALAGTLGVGNIAGVALALISGGPGAIFWMWISALTAMIIKYAEIVLALHYRKRKHGRENEYYGSAMYYIREGLGKGRLARGLAATFALLCILNSISMGSVIQVNVIAESLKGRLGIPALATGIIITLLTAIVVFGGIRSISGLTVRLVPFMSAVYILLSMYIILTNLGELPRTLSMIFTSAFRVESAFGGILGFFLSRSVRFGVSRGLLSNEAGCGTATIAHAESSTKSPALQGLWGIVEVFVDTILLCSMTAFVILISYDAIGGGELNGIMLTITAFEFTFGDAAGIIICAAILL
ncbi:MAG: sodium:alanine symporter family protein, partial [Clostridiales bacterium]|nr:sodium:alanine symporter family protein [Clostridiales bacterium]